MDHSYEKLADPWDRAYSAVERNLKLLNEPNLARDFITANHARLQHNVDLVEQNVFLKYCDQKTSHYDRYTRSELHKLYTNSGPIQITQKLF